jgi:DNA-binding response OmpR family regulator
MKKILVVEDDQKTAMALVIRLKANGYDVCRLSRPMRSLAQAMPARSNLT